MSDSPQATSVGTSPSISGTAHAQFAEGLHFSAFRLCNRDINLSARKLLLLAVVRPTLEYGSDMWEANKTQVVVLESVMLRGAKHILECSSKTCNEAVRGGYGA